MMEGPEQRTMQSDGGLAAEGLGAVAGGAVWSEWDRGRQGIVGIYTGVKDPQSVPAEGGTERYMSGSDIRVPHMLPGVGRSGRSHSTSSTCANSNFVGADAGVTSGVNPVYASA